MTGVRRAFAVASIAWAAALPLATFVASRPVGSSGPYLFAFVVYVVGSLVCHQRSERSFFLWAHQMPVCARCTGIYAGAALTVLCWLAARTFAPVARRLPPSVARSPEGFALLPGVARSPKGVALLACAPAAATLVYEWTTGVMPAHWIRAASGVWLGAGIAVLVTGHADARHVK